jgi:uncharacterized membrane protein (DUF485 family)
VSGLGSATNAANTNADVRAGLRVIRGGREARMGPAPDRTPLLLAADLNEAQARDRSREAEEIADVMPSGADERVFLELERKSPYEETEAQRVKRWQDELLRTAGSLFPEQEREEVRAEEAEAPPVQAQEPEPAGARPAPVREARKGAEILGRLERGRIEERMRADERMERARRIGLAAEKQRKAAIKANKLMRNIIKGVQAAAAESVVPIITLVIQLNLETVNKWIFKISIPGIVLADKHPTFDATDVATGCVNMFIVFAVGIMLIQIVAVTVIIVMLAAGFNEVLSSILEFFSGLF